MSIFDAEVNRTYKCTNSHCNCHISVTQEVREDFLVQCPFCEQDALVLHNGSLSGQTVQSDTTKPRTFGMQGQINREQAEERGETTKQYDKTPWWRKGKKKIDYEILKNPIQYIHHNKK